MGLVFGIMFSNGNVENGFGIFRLTEYLFSLIGKVFEAGLGFVEAKTKLGICYLEGKGTERNEQAVFQYLYEAVKAKCYHTAGYPLAKCYIFGIGTASDTGASIKYIKAGN